VYAVYRFTVNAGFHHISAVCHVPDCRTRCCPSRHSRVVSVRPRYATIHARFTRADVGARRTKLSITCVSRGAASRWGRRRADDRDGGGQTGVR